MEIHILRLGHRLPRDERISTHVALVARAFGAQQMVYSGQHDDSLESSVLRLVGNWGGRTVSGSLFSVSYENNYRRVIKEHKEKGFKIVHLTMYGIPLPEALPKLKTMCPNKKGASSPVPSELKTQDARLLIIVGSEAVPGDVYQLADFNISVTNQPHSEVAALAIVLDRLMDGKEFGLQFPGKLRIEPTEKGKKIIDTGNSELKH